MPTPTGIRKAIRAKVKSMLESGGVEANFYEGRLDPLKPDKCPAINLHVLDDDAEAIGAADDGYIRVYELSVFCTVKGQDVIQPSDDIAVENLDELSDQVFNILAKPYQTLEKTVRRCTYTGSRTTISGDGEDRVMVRQMTFDCQIEVSL